MSEPKPGFDAGRHCDAMAPALGLTITDQQRPAVLQFLTIASGMATIVQAAPLDDGSFELAPVFRPGPVSGGGSA
ncbi:DUF4089 domain-containing protein [Bosea sp. PAMC 26642]|uniref:DUF4089 domain-containing protein n=1 Tax=Bosea sp. (strain PAMC 26642) TaxID=1792307 RepID=UPI00076FE073|nr:DUF4089 domain-containing protein [Bosea sp. PAMC 26642]AMJ60705.1 hypothetical protein AXW83_10745 [Bosea sp. PAMC 26642]